MSFEWYSAKMRYVVFIVGRGSTLLYDSVFLFCAKNYQDAFDRALIIGRKQEEQYLNEDNEIVKWKFSEIITLDYVGKLDRNGVEICADPTRLPDDQKIKEDIEYFPEKKPPTQSI